MMLPKISQSGLSSRMVSTSILSDDDCSPTNLRSASIVMGLLLARGRGLREVITYYTSSVSVKNLAPDVFL